MAILLVYELRLVFDEYVTASDPTLIDITPIASIAFSILGVTVIGIPLTITTILFLKKKPHQILEAQEKFVQKQEQNRTTQARMQAIQAPDQIENAGILGAAAYGNLEWCVDPWFVLPEPELNKHGVVIGGSGSGKTVSLLRIAYVAALVYGYRVFFLDAKGDRDTAAKFLAMMHQAGLNPRMFPREPISGWRGDGNAQLNRLMAVEVFSEPYYRAVTKRVLSLVCGDPAGPPRSSAEFFSRFTEELRDKAKLSSARDLAGVELRYRAFFDALNGRLDTGWSWEDTSAAYLLLDGLSLKEEAASLGRYLVEDFSHYATSRKKPGRDLLIIDEYSALAQSGTDAANLVERLRSYGCAVVLSSQSYAGLGEPQDAERILDAANWLLLHRSAAPERLTARAGMQKMVKEMYQFGGNLDTAVHEQGRVQLEEEDAVHPDQARRLATGEAIMIAHGRSLKAVIAQVPQPGAAEIQAARQWIDGATPRPRAAQANGASGQQSATSAAQPALQDTQQQTTGPQKLTSTNGTGQLPLPETLSFHTRSGGQ